MAQYYRRRGGMVWDRSEYLAEFMRASADHRNVVLVVVVTAISSAITLSPIADRGCR